MKVTTEKLEGSRVSLDVECSWKEADDALNNAYRKIVRQVVIPGFRRGKAPRSLVQRYYGSELHEEAVQIVVPQQYIKAVEEAKIQPVADPEFSEIQLAQGEPLRFRAVVPVRPDVELEDYGSISVKFENPSITEDDIDEQVEKLRQNMAELRPMEGDKALLAGHFVTCRVKSVENGDLDSESDGEEKDAVDEEPNGGLDEQFNYFEVGQTHPSVPGLDEALIGMKKGEVKQFEHTTTPEDEGESSTSLFEVKVNETYERYLPDDMEEVAKNFGKTSEKELREEIKQQLEEIRLKTAKRNHLAKVEDEIVKKAQCDIPDAMVNTHAQALLEDFAKKLSDAGITLDNYLASTRTEWDEFESELNLQAEKEVRRELVLDAIAEKENVEVPEHLLNEVLNGLALEMDQKPEIVKTTLEIRGALDDIKTQARRMETLKTLASRAALNAGTPFPPPEKAAEDTEKEESKTHQEETEVEQITDAEMKPETEPEIETEDKSNV